MIYLHNFWYLLRHKWYVFQAACELGIPWLGLIHDLSKFLPHEWIPYAKWFYGNYESIKDAPVWAKAHGCVFLEDIKWDFDRAWLKHIHANKHHWQWWILQEDDGDRKILIMPDRYTKEMLADWIGAGKARLGSKARGHEPETLTDWYWKNNNARLLHAQTRVWLEKAIRKWEVDHAH